LRYIIIFFLLDHEWFVQLERAKMQAYHHFEENNLVMGYQRLFNDIKSWWNTMFVEPLLKNEDLEQIVIKETKHLPTPQEKARQLFDWMQEHIVYDQEKLERKKYEETGLRNSLEVFYDKKGLCGEQAYLYIVLSRLAGLDSWYVRVDETHNGKSNHACAAVDLGSTVFVDPAFHTFDISHKKIRHWNDFEVYQAYAPHKLEPVHSFVGYYVAAAVLGLKIGLLVKTGAAEQLVAAIKHYISSS